MCPPCVGARAVAEAVQHNPGRCNTIAKRKKVHHFAQLEMRKSITANKWRVTPYKTGTIKWDHIRLRLLHARVVHLSGFVALVHRPRGVLACCGVRLCPVAQSALS